MSIQRFNAEFETLMRRMVEAQECAQGNIEDEFRRIIRATVNSCATMYGFSAQEALKRIDSNGEIIEVVVSEKNPKQQKEEEKAEKLRVKEAEKAEKLRLKETEKSEKAEKLRLKETEKAFKEAEKAKKLKDKDFEKIETLRRKEYENAKKANESSERTLMKDEDVFSKAAEKFRMKEAKKLASKLEKKSKKKQKEKVVFIIESDDEESLASTVLMSDSEDEEPYVLFQNIPLINEINSIRDVKKFKNWKKLSPGVKLARQILDI
jgi:hypothetical protein